MSTCGGIFLRALLVPAVITQALYREIPGAVLTNLSDLVRSGSSLAIKRLMLLSFSGVSSFLSSLNFDGFDLQANGKVPAVSVRHCRG